MPASENQPLRAVVNEDGSASIAAGDAVTAFDTTSIEAGREAIMMHAIAHAQDRRAPVRLHVTEPDGTWPLIVHADGDVEPDETSADTTAAAPGPDDAAAGSGDAPQEAGGADAAGPAALAAAPTRAPRDTPAPATTALPVADAAYDDDEDDSDVVDDPGPALPLRRRKREAGDAQPEGPAPAPKSAAATPKATEGIDPVVTGAQPAAARTASPAPSPEPGPAPARAADPLADDAADVFAPLHISPPTPETRAAQQRRTAAADDASRAGARRGAEGGPIRGRRDAREQDGRRSFLTPERREEPASRGWRGALARAGVRVPPSAEERAERADAAAVSQHWPGPRTIAVVNGKGGSGKTPTTILTAAVFARYGGAGVLAWDNNQTRGTLGWRTEQGPHDASLHDLLPETERLLSAQAQSADLARFVHHQTRDRYDVLRSRPMLLADEQRVESEDVARIHAVAAKYYRLIIMDSGNDESDPMWRRMIDLSDQLVVATTTRAEHAEAGALLLEALGERDERSATLAANAVAIVSQADPQAPPAHVRGVVDGYRDLTREVATIPYDPAMAGGLLHFGALRPATQRAWLAAAAAIARGLSPQHA